MPYQRSHQIEQRLEALITLLRGGPHSARNLSQLLHTSHPTLARCLKALRDRGYVIRSVRHAEGWCYELHSDTATAHQGDR